MGINKIDDRFRTSQVQSHWVKDLRQAIYTIPIKNFRIDPIWTDGIKLSPTSRGSDPAIIRRTSRLKILLNGLCNDLCNGGRLTFLLRSLKGRERNRNYFLP